MRAEMLATGANIHDVRGKLNVYLILSRFVHEGTRSPEDLAKDRKWLGEVERWLRAFVSKGGR
jgi:hypothetical protein